MNLGRSVWRGLTIWGLIPASLRLFFRICRAPLKILRRGPTTHIHNTAPTPVIVLPKNEEARECPYNSLDILSSLHNKIMELVNFDSPREANKPKNKENQRNMDEEFSIETIHWRNT